MRVRILFLLILILTTSAYLTMVTYDIIPPIYWSFLEFSNPNYFKNLETKWQNKSSDYLIRKLYSLHTMRFGVAASILVGRNEQRAVSVLKKRVLSNYIDDSTHLSACDALVKISPSVAKKALKEVAKRYKSIKYDKAIYYAKYYNALLSLSSMKDESIYPICLEMAKSNNRLDRESSLNGMLYNFDNHWEEVLPLYLEYLNDKNGSKMAAINGIMNMKRPETISTLEKFASQNKIYDRQVNEAITYIKEAQK